MSFNILAIHFADIKFILVGLFLGFPAFLDGITQFFMIRESNNRMRLFTGFLGGIGIVVLSKTLVKIMGI